MTQGQTDLSGQNQGTSQLSGLKRSQIQLVNSNLKTVNFPMTACAKVSHCLDSKGQVNSIFLFPLHILLAILQPRIFIVSVLGVFRFNYTSLFVLECPVETYCLQP